MGRIKEKLYKLRLTLLFAAIVFFIMLLSMLLVSVGMFLMFQLHIPPGREPRALPLFMFAAVSLLVGTVMAAVFSQRPLAPLREIMDASDRIARGDYSVRLRLKGPDEFRQLNESFNHMAEEIGSVEMLRNDFVNNFSHEFKTPIVSIRGFAKMLKRENLSLDERQEYLDIIIGESERLTELATNVLNLSKVEQQSILTDKTRFNVSEQIRLVIALLDSKWAEKQINFTCDCGEIFVCGNEEMLKQVWINLLDNAIKFSPQGGVIKIKSMETRETVYFTVANQGDEISPKTASHIFDKFYQGDTSHGTKGNGLGLTIAKRIMELHNGSIQLAQTGKAGTVFEVTLPAGLISGASTRRA